MQHVLLNYERLSQTSSQQCYSITDELAKGIVPFKYINDLIVCLEEASYWIAAKIVCFDLDHGWSYMGCNKCIIKVEQDGNSFFFIQNAIQRQKMNFRYRLQVRVMDRTGLITLLLWSREAVQLMGKTAKELKEGLIDDDECSYPSELDDIIDKNLMFKVMVKESNIYKQDEVFKVLKFADDESLFEKCCHPSLKYSDSLFEGAQNKGGDELFESCGSSVTEISVDSIEK
ncbi:hypothetical protein P3S68_016839 [Capsicum galapagoense]